VYTGVSLADVQTETCGTSIHAAGYNSFFKNAVPIVLIPLLEAFLERSGHRTVIASNRLTSPDRDTSILLNLASISIVDCRVMRRRILASSPDCSDIHSFQSV